MRKLSSFVVLMVGVLGLGPSSARSEFALFRDIWGDVIVATDTTKEGLALTPPTPEKPVYYLGRSLGCKLGSIRGDHLPDERKMNRIIEKILAKQGYISAHSGGHEPELHLVVQWGYLEPRSDDLMWFLGYNARDDIASPVFPGILGMEVFRRDLRSTLIRTILENGSDPIYGIIITAFEFKSAKTPKPVIYWQTRIGLPASGKSMDEALPTMLAAAGSAVGRPADSPVLLSADLIRNGRVDYGELKILGIVK